MNKTEATFPSVISMYKPLQFALQQHIDKANIRYSTFYIAW